MTEHLLWSKSKSLFIRIEANAFSSTFCFEAFAFAFTLYFEQMLYFYSWDPIGRIYKNEGFTPKEKVQGKGIARKEKAEGKGFTLIRIHNHYLFLASKSFQKEVKGRWTAWAELGRKGELDSINEWMLFIFMKAVLKWWIGTWSTLFLDQNEPEGGRYPRS